MLLDLFLCPSQPCMTVMQGERVKDDRGRKGRERMEQERVYCQMSVLPFWGKRKGQPKTGLFQSEPEIKKQKREEYHPILSGKLSSYFLSSSCFFN